MRRKLFCVSAAMASGVWIAGLNVLAAAGIAIASLVYAVMLYMEPEYDVCRLHGLAAACAVSLLIGAVRMSLQQFYYDSWQDAAAILHQSHDQKTIRAEVLKVSLKKDKKPKLTIRLKNSGVKCLLSYYGSGDVQEMRMLTGSLIEFRGDLDEPDTAGNPRCFDYRMYLRSQGICCVSHASSVRVIMKNAGFAGMLKRRILDFRESFIKRISSSDSEALLRGILFGDTDNMDEDMTEDFRRNGTAHILAVSALHIGLLYSIFRALRKKFTFPGMTSLFLVILGVYGTMTLWTVSVTRAVMLIVLMELGERLDRPYDLLTSLGFVSMLVLMREPYALYNTSFIMSYLAALSIGVILPALKRKVPDRLPESIKTTLAVQLGLTPFIAYAFNMVPLGAFIINMPVIFLLTVIVTLAAAAMPVYIAVQSINVVIGAKALMEPIVCLLGNISRVLIYINERFAGIGILSPDVVSPPLFMIASYYGILFFICSESFRIARIRKNMNSVSIQAWIAVIIVLISCVQSVSPFDRADIIMVDVGQGDCMHFRFNNRRTDVMIDGGGNDDYNVGKKTLKPYFLKNGVRKVDLALATHLHTDHYKGILELEDENMIKQKLIYGKTGDAVYFKDNKLTGKAYIRSDGTAGSIKKEGSKSSAGHQDRIEIIWPDERDPDTDDENKNSLIFKVYIRGLTVLVTGDLGEEGEHALVERYKGTDVLDCDVLKVCHHGSRYSSSSEFINEVSPEVAVIGVGKNNIYGHPADEVIKRLEKHGAKVFRTDKDGAIGLRRTRAGIEICSGNR